MFFLVEYIFQNEFCKVKKIPKDNPFRGTQNEIFIFPHFEEYLQYFL